MRSITNEAELNGEEMMAVKFFATWCGPCKTIDPTIKKMESEFSNVAFGAVNIDDAPELAQKYKIKNLPSLILMRNGQEVSRISGVVMVEPLRKAFKDLTKEE